jgi:large conductance mechanosensitive channel
VGTWRRHYHRCGVRRLITSFVNDILSRPSASDWGCRFQQSLRGSQQGDPVGPYLSLAAAKDAGAVTINYGVFINTIINFLIIAAAVFFFIVRTLAAVERRQKAKEPAAPPAPTTKECPFCKTSIPLSATRCPN